MLSEKGTDKIVFTLRLAINDRPDCLGNVFMTIGKLGAGVGDITRMGAGVNQTIRDIEVLVDSQDHLQTILTDLGNIEGIRIQKVYNHVEELHRGGKIAMKAKFQPRSISDIRKIYTPGVAYICRLIQEDPSRMYDYTYIPDTVAIVTNGTAILGLGNIGVKPAMPVMEGKAFLFSSLVGINGIPILIDSRDTDEIVQVVSTISQSFGAIKLEDIAAPECFEIEDRLTAMLDIPVMHDDQHGTAVVVLASLLNVCRYTGLHLQSQKIGIVGLGAAGMGITKLLKAYGVQQLLGTDIREAALTMFEAIGGSPTDLHGLMETSTIVITTTGVPGLIKPKMVRPRQVILALSNPNPEIRPEDALSAGALYAADGRSVNNALAFPGLFRGALKARARTINNQMKIAAAHAIADEADQDDLVPMLLKEGLHQRIAEKVERSAFESGANQIITACT